MIKYVLIMILGVFIASISQILLKISANKHYENKIKEYLNPFVIGGYGLMCVSMLLSIVAYKGLEYKYGPAIESLGFIFVFLMSCILLKEKVTFKKIVGYIAIVLGVVIFFL